MFLNFSNIGSAAKLFLFAVMVIAVCAAETPAHAQSTIRVNLRSDGTQSDRNHSTIRVSPDGRYVAFESVDPNMR